MKNLPVVIVMLIMLICVGIDCDADNPDPADSILYQDINPDTTLAYEIEVLNPSPYKFQGNFSYLIDSFVQCSWNSDYLAVKLIKDGHAVFGWIDIDGYEIPTMKDMAVNLTFDKKILAGQKQ